MTTDTKTEVKDNASELVLNPINLFISTVYSIKIPQFLDVSRAVVKENLSKNTEAVNEIYPVIMTNNLNQDQRLNDLVSFIVNSAWNILDSQGFNVENFRTYLSDFWCQEHHKHSAMEQHVHGYGSQIVGFYFLDVPKDSSIVLFHDPRMAKVQINLPEKNTSNATYASSIINFVPEEGLCLFAPAWLAHSFTRHASEEPLRFIHFNVYTQLEPAINLQYTDVEVI